ncbi:MAG: IPTL-CTERM sorting domain-containing protein [Dehalococcoidia bacterium]|nr:IPTL-CTERM sorting domain-containing protein [Dehalococcoidia bacterium]
MLSMLKKSNFGLFVIGGISICFIVVTATYSMAQTLTPASGSPFSTGDRPDGVAVSPDGKFHFVANNTDNTISVFSISSNGALSEISGSPFACTLTNPYYLTTNRAGNLLSVGASNGIMFFDIAADGSLSEVGICMVSPPPYFEGLAVSPDDKYLFAAERTNNKVYVFSLAPFGIVGPPFPTGGSWSCDVSINPAGTYLFVSNYNSHNVTVFNIAGDGTLSQIAGSPFSTGDTYPGRIAMNPAGTLLFVCHMWSDKMTVFDIAGDGTLSQIAGSPFLCDDGPNGVAVSKSGNFLFVSNLNGNDISMYQINVDGSLEAVSGSPFVSGGIAPTSIKTSPTTNLLFASLRDSDQVASFSFTEHPQVGVPTLTQWGMIIFSLLLAGTAIFVLRRRSYVA